MKSSYIEHSICMFSQAIEHYKKEGATVLDNTYSDHYTLYLFKSLMYNSLLKTEEEIIEQLKASELLQEKPQEVVKSLGEKLRKQSLGYAWSVGCSNPFHERPYIQLQVHIYNDLANMLFLMSTIESENVISLGL